ncbi:Major allergen Mal d 1 [Linum grandiflorum]
MGVTSATHEFKSCISAPRMYKALLDNATLFPKIVPQYKSEFIQGDGSVGSIRLTTFPDKDQVISVKHRIDAQDPAEYYGKFTLLEGGPLSADPNFESVVNEVKIDAVGDGCIVKATNHFHTKEEVDLKELIDTTGQQTLGLYKAVEAYLLSNPTTYA